MRTCKRCHGDPDKDYCPDCGDPSEEIRDMVNDEAMVQLSMPIKRSLDE